MSRLGYCIRRWKPGKLEIRQFGMGGGAQTIGALSRASVAINPQRLPGGIYKTGSAHATNLSFDAKDIGDLAGDRISLRSESSRLSSSSFAINLFPLYSTHHRSSRKLAASRISKQTYNITIIFDGFRKLGMLSPRDHAPTVPSRTIPRCLATQRSVSKGQIPPPADD